MEKLDARDCGEDKKIKENTSCSIILEYHLSYEDLGVCVCVCVCVCDTHTCIICVDAREYMCSVRVLY